MVACSVARVELASFRILHGHYTYTTSARVTWCLRRQLFAFQRRSCDRGVQGPMLTEHPGSGMGCAFRRAASVAPRRVGRWGA